MKKSENLFCVIVAGGRGFTDKHLLTKTLDGALSSKDAKNIVIISGGAKGADSMAEKYAKGHDIKCLRVPARWDSEGKKAGYVRNREMLQFADALIAFWDGQSVGTKNMIEIAQEAGLQCRVINYTPSEEPEYSKKKWNGQKKSDYNKFRRNSGY